MCGIAGTLSLGARLGPEDRESVLAMTRRLRHRGPDRQAVEGDDLGVLGSARLRVTDLSDKADLPLANEDGSVWISYNGAVTNFRDLRRRFRLDDKHRFRSGSDAETLLHLYEELGPGFLEHLSGMFAFCLQDRRKGKAYLVRDFYGLRPVFYAVKGDRLHFSSEIKALLELPGMGRALDQQALWDFLFLAYIPGDATPFRDIRELQAGHLIEVDLAAGRFAERPYYGLKFSADDALTEETCAREVRSLMKESVRLSLDCDAPVGLTLSGGVDTSSLLALAKDLDASRTLHTFSLKINEPSFDESRYQKIMVEFARPIHHEIAVDAADIVENLLSAIAHLDEPVGDGAAIPTFLLARKAREHVRVLLSGEGGDEIFNAYETHRAYKARLLYRKVAPPWARRALKAVSERLPTSYSKLSWDFVSKRFTQGSELDVPEAHVYWRHALSEDEQRRIWSGSPCRPTPQVFSEYYRGLDGADGLDRVTLMDLRYYFVDDLMVKNDRMIMAHSVETRFPYMEKNLVEYMARIPAPLRMRGFQGRRIQKLAMEGLLPREISRRQNMGLELPYSVWFLEEFRSLAEETFSRKNVEALGLIRHEVLMELWREHLGRKKDNGRALWCVLNLLLWFKLFVSEDNYESYLTRP
jgi:asparagine synthase (glutamine-hydrolysing)